MKTPKHQNIKTPKCLYIDTANHNQVEVAIVDGQQKIHLVNFSSQRQFEIKDKLLKIIDKVLVASKINLKNLNGVIVVNKSSEMTSLRIGIAVANALAYSLNIPIAGIKKSSLLPVVIDTIKQAKIFKPIIPIYEINPMLKNEK
jgi:tRNA A37 threonylcarbamoyladenosine modification protein TsaB